MLFEFIGNYREEEMVILFGMVVIIIIIITTTSIMLFKKIKNENNIVEIGKVNCTYESELGKFKADGELEKFIIKKDERYEFLVENGVIIACKDKEHNKQFIYYGGGGGAR